MALDNAWPELRADALADGAVLAYLSCLARTGRCAQRAAAVAPNSGSPSAIHNRHVNVKMSLPAAEEAREDDVSLAPRALPVFRARVVASHTEPIRISDPHRVHAHAKCHESESAFEPLTTYGPRIPSVALLARARVETELVQASSARWAAPLLRAADLELVEWRAEPETQRSTVDVRRLRIAACGQATKPGASIRAAGLLGPWCTDRGALAGLLARLGHP